MAETMKDITGPRRPDGPGSGDGGPAVEMSGIYKSFSGVPVLRGVDFEVRAGEVHALAGGNGAGKSTLMKILQGVYSMDAGEIRIDGEPVRLSSIHDARAAGVGMVFQEFSLVPTLTVAQNVFLAAEPMGPLGMINDRAKSQIPGLGYTVTYAVGNTLLTVWGMVIIMLMS